MAAFDRKVYEMMPNASRLYEKVFVRQTKKLPQAISCIVVFHFARKVTSKVTL